MGIKGFFFVYITGKALSGELSYMGIGLVQFSSNTIKILKFGTPQTIAIIVVKIEKFDETLH